MLSFYSTEWQDGVCETTGCKTLLSKLLLLKKSNWFQREYKQFKLHYCKKTPVVKLTVGQVFLHADAELSIRNIDNLFLFY
jgi:hypothetical protein